MKRIAVVGAVLVRDGRILAAQRGEGMSLAGRWEFPGGKIEPGETPQETLRREIAEELGCRIEIGELVARTEHVYDFGLVDLATYWCRLIAGEGNARAFFLALKGVHRVVIFAQQGLDPLAVQIHRAAVRLLLQRCFHHSL